jgi:hypothetical protein
MKLDYFNVGKTLSLVFFVTAILFYCVAIIKSENMFTLGEALAAMIFGIVFSVTSLFMLVTIYGQKILDKLNKKV